jgi:hypothetical protein
MNLVQQEMVRKPGVSMKKKLRTEQRLLENLDADGAHWGEQAEQSLTNLSRIDAKLWSQEGAISLLE